MKNSMKNSTPWRKIILAFKRQKQASVWRLTPETSTKLAFNARNKHLPGVKRQKQATFGHLTPETSSSLALNARIAQQGRFTRLIGAGMLSP